MQSGIGGSAPAAAAPAWRAVEWPLGAACSAVSSQKARFVRDGFDLDLTYVTPTCIAMSLPALGAEARYRNPMVEVRRFLDTRHAAAFLVFNLVWSSLTTIAGAVAWRMLVDARPASPAEAPQTKGPWG